MHKIAIFFMCSPKNCSFHSPSFPVYIAKNATIKNDFWFIRCIVNGALVEGKREDQVGKEKSNYVLWLDIKLIWFLKGFQMQMAIFHLRNSLQFSNLFLCIKKLAIRRNLVSFYNCTNIKLDWLSLSSVSKPWYTQQPVDHEKGEILLFYMSVA